MNITGYILKELRVKRNITLEQLANEINQSFNINLTRSMLSKWETGKAAPVYDHLKRLASYYGVTTDFLLGFDQKKYAHLIDSNNDVTTNKRKIYNTKKHYTIESIVKELEDDEFSNKDVLLIKDFITFIKLKKHNKLPE